MTIASSIPGEIKLGFCIAALSAGVPFAPLLAKLGKANVSIATMLLVVLTAATIIALPLGLPFAIDAVDVQLKISGGICLAAAVFPASYLWFWAAASESGGPTSRGHWSDGLSALYESGMRP